MTTGVDQQTSKTLLEAFARFQEHCEKLDAAQAALRERLAQAEIRLQEKNRELANRIREIDFVKGRLAAVIEAIPDPLFVVGSDGGIELANSAAQRAFPGGAEDAAELDALLARPEPPKDVEIVLQRPHGEMAMVATASPLADADDRRSSQVLVLKDVTEYRRLRERLARDSRLAALGQVAANVAHEIRNPLAAVEGFGRLLEQDLKETSPAALRLLARMLFAANQMNSVVSNLLNYAREAPLSLVAAPLAVLVREVMDMMELRAVESGVRMTLRDDGTQGACLLDPCRMKEVVVNLVANAIQACPSRTGGRIELAIARRRDRIEFTVADNGHGIPEDALQRIFEPFYTLKDDGIGLGLALCKRIVEEHDGTISAENRPEGGALFRIRIPAAAHTRPASAPREAMAQESSHD